MKDYRLMLLGIAIILFGIAYEVTLIGYAPEEFLRFIVKTFKFIGIIVTVIGYFEAEKK
ncbi:hypothetical protein Calkro_2162 [Caldicellulosiruptor kronotskyensis 2002]|uniref:Uncharacterized protein n=1 Tax=Caldicellulosiruptor kronotskyensis (strain DSM 18902 / VKM B-2412 / 2002) TaxID=632348 RepID=E4SGX5_CALK2|nr:hypothetical protein [Caldicellulosiruptor kronotskyensis]ADQ47000.1 hypothetical protein Calkro_2162 [Caldicellulosiruptor kronotskyensis 2002]